MPSFEAPAQQPDRQPSIDVPLPDEADNDWCAMFNQAYGRQGMRSIVNTYIVMRQSRALYRCEGRSGARSFYEHDLGDVPENGLFFDGEVLGVRLVPIADEWSEEFGDVYVPHLALTDVVDVMSERQWFFPNEEIWVPLTENGETILLYK